MGQRRPLESIHESEEKYRNLIENISDWVWETDKNMVFTYSNPRVKDYLGFIPAEIMGRSMYDLMPREWADRIKNFVEAMNREGKPVAVCEKAMNAKSGEVVYFEMTVNLIFDENGRVTGYRGICRDIRDRKRAEEAQRKAYGELEHMVKERTKELEHARATLQAILDTVPIGILVVDAKTHLVTYHSSGIERTFGGPLVGKTYGVDMYPNQILHLDGSPMRNEEMPLYISLMFGKQVSDMEILARQPDGQEHTVLASTAPIKDAQGRITSAVAAIMDITKLKNAERGLQEAKSEAEMYLDLMGHDINNLSQVGIGYLELALDLLDSTGRLEPKDRPLLEKALETQLNSSKLIMNVRKIQRSRAGGLKYRPIDLCRILADLKDHYSQVPDREVHIGLTSSPQCFIYANELVHDVFTNLIGNAIKHSPADRRLDILIDLRKARLDGKDFYRVSIEDNGPGIPDELKERLFTRFEPGKTKATGRGLGLYLVKTLLEDMSGSISVEDRVKGDHRKGARFIVLLPAILDR
ncbi:putative histidine kinase [Methanocella paludicola SANAE]|uniref:histidine kinase n=2 Tax=Methanocella TaxID=570266 RepID=D1Z0P2_METPS|nr:putative histidine kinase [Methanocella paludicola SANAE]